jgi:hypothetical protein
MCIYSDVKKFSVAYACVCVCTCSHEYALHINSHKHNSPTQPFSFHHEIPISILFSTTGMRLKPIAREYGFTAIAFRITAFQPPVPGFSATGTRLFSHQSPAFQPRGPGFSATSPRLFSHGDPAFQPPGLGFSATSPRLFSHRDPAFQPPGPTFSYVVNLTHLHSKSHFSTF